MINVNESLIATKEIYKDIIESPGKLFEMMRIDLRGVAEKVLSEILKQELTVFLGRDMHERSPEKTPNHRNGYYNKNYTIKNFLDFDHNISLFVA